MRSRTVPRVLSSSFSLLLILLFAVAVPAQTTTTTTKADLGSRTARNGFHNEDDIKAKFENWAVDSNARAWLSTMGFRSADIQQLVVTKPHDEKADIEVAVKTKSGVRREGISIKLVSSPNGFNQIDKRWLAHYAAMWEMPADVRHALSLFVGEIAPTKPGRSKDRMFLDELDADSRKSVIDFFTTRKKSIVSDLFAGDGPHAAGWVMVAYKTGPNVRWVLQRVEKVVEFFSSGPVSLTTNGNLKIGRVTMQRKGGDAGRATAKMLQFKIDPALLIGN